VTVSDLLPGMNVLLSEDERREVMRVIETARSSIHYRRQVRATCVPPLPKSSEDAIRASEDEELKSLDRIREKFRRW
jgi:hypothetical protein